MPRALIVLAVSIWGAAALGGQDQTHGSKL